MGTGIGVPLSCSAVADEKDRRGRRRSLGKEWRRVWKMCLGFLCVPLSNMQTACHQKRFWGCAIKSSGFSPAAPGIGRFLHPLRIRRRPPGNAGGLSDRGGREFSRMFTFD